MLQLVLVTKAELLSSMGEAFLLICSLLLIAILEVEATLLGRTESRLTFCGEAFEGLLFGCEGGGSLAETTVDES